MNMLVPVLINLLYSQDENIKVLAVVSLVNYTNNHPTMKNIVMAVVRCEKSRIISQLFK